MQKYIILFLFLIASILGFSFLFSTKKSPEPKDLGLGSAEARKNKLFVLVVASDDRAYYRQLQELWKSYMNYDPEHVEIYFMKSDKKLPKNFILTEDEIWTKTKDCFVPGVLNKTILSFEAMLPRIRKEFDYVLRTNLSSFYVFPRLLKFMETLPQKRCYCAVKARASDIPFGAGAGFILSPDMVELLVQNKNRLLNSDWHADDVVIGDFFFKNGIDIIPSARLDFLSREKWETQQGGYLDSVPYPEYRFVKGIPDEVFHFRLKQDDDTKRDSDELFIYQALIKQFYRC